MTLLALLWGCSRDEPASIADGADEELKEGKLDVVDKATLPMAEVSGLGRRVVAGKPSYLAISDSVPAIVTFRVDGGVATDIQKHDVSSIIGGGAPQYEAVSGDSTGKVFALAESSNRIVVFDAGLTKVVHTIELQIPSSFPLANAWAKDENSRGEGMLLLANGHVLVAKEKDPVAIVEFAPGDESPQGYSFGLALGDRAFPLASGATSKLVPVKHWLLKDSQTKLAGDVSELALDVDGRLLLLTDQDRAILRVERGLRVDEDKVELKAVYRLPGSVEKPEGLVLVDGVPFVAIDVKNAGETLFTIERLP